MITSGFTGLEGKIKRVIRQIGQAKNRIKKTAGLNNCHKPRLNANGHYKNKKENINIACSNL